VCAVVASLVPAVSSGAEPTVVRHPVYGGTEALFGSCPEVEVPPAGTVCVDNYVIVFRGYVDVVGGGSVAPPKALWYVYAESVRLEFTGAEEPIATVLRFGIGELQGEASVDQVHLQVASASVQVPMSDGSTFEFAGTWQATSDRMVFGNDGPATGFPRHYNDRCLTFNAHGHQKFVFAQMTGTLDGQPVQSYSFDFAATIFNNRFQYIEVPHGGCS
jgi:hypothetical protein